MSASIGQNEEGQWCVYDALGAQLFECGIYPNDAADICHYLNGGPNVSASYARDLMANATWRNEEHVK